MSSSKNYSPSTRRGSDTHSKVINAGIRCISENGFHSASTNKIAKEADVTWGVLQHQFGDKARLLEAILEYCFEQQMGKISLSTSISQPLDARIDALLEAIWENQQTDSALVLWEILYGVRRDPELSERFQPTLQKLRDLYDQQWQLLFSDIAISPELMAAVKELTFGALRGLSYELSIRSSASAINRAKELLKQQVLVIFNAEA